MSRTTNESNDWVYSYKHQRVAAQNRDGSIPQRSTVYTFEPADWTTVPKPGHHANDDPWPPTEVGHLLVPKADQWADFCGACQKLREDNEKCLTECTIASLGDKKWQSHFKLQWSGDKGVGVFCKHPIEADTFLGLYTGHIRHRENRGGLETTQSTSPADVSDEYAIDMRINGTKNNGITAVIDSARAGHFTRFINSATATSKPRTNAILCEGRVGKYRAIWVESLADLSANEELLVSYGSDFYKK